MQITLELERDQQCKIVHVSWSDAERAGAAYGDDDVNDDGERRRFGALDIVREMHPGWDIDCMYGCEVES